MQVTLIQFTPEPELTIAAAARLCYSPVSATEIRQRLSPKQVENLLNRVIPSGHHSVLEHASFTLAIDGLSRAASHQLVRHRLASYSQQSQRYVSLKTPEYVTPPSIAQRSDLREAFDAAVLAAFRLYDQLQAAGVPAEDARFVLPNACTTRLVMTMNFRELMHACSIRLCTHAQWEIREIFAAAREEVRKVAPFLAGYLHIKCETLGYCDEPETCGIRPLKVEVLGQ